MDKREALEKAKQFSQLVVEKYQPEKVILFGSYAREDYHSDSDIDIAVIVNKINGSLIEIEKELFRLRRKIDLNIEPLLIIKEQDKSGFAETIMEYGRVVYQK